MRIWGDFPAEFPIAGRGLTAIVTPERLVLGFLTALAIVAVCSVQAQADTFWQLRAGADIWRTGQVPLVDTYSYTAAGLPWPDHSWLWQAATYALYHVGGMPLLTAGVATLVLGAFALVYRCLVGTVYARAVLMVPAIGFVSVLVSLRPQCLSLFMLALLLWLLIRERYAFVTPTFFVWANAHGGVTLGFAALVAASCAALLRAVAGVPGEWRRVRILGTLVVTCVLAMCATPLGLELIPFVLESEARLHQASIAEWMPPLRADSFHLVFWLAALAFVALLIHRRRRLLEFTWADTVSIAIALMLTVLAARSVRQVGPFGLAVTVAVSRLLDGDFALWPLQAAISRSVQGKTGSWGLALTAVLAIAIAVVVWSWSRTRADWTPMSAEAVQAVRGCAGPIYNNYYNGGFLIWFVPERPVFIDNRQDPFPLSLILEQSRVERGKTSYQPLFAQYGVRCAFLSARSRLGARLHADGWQTQFWDDRFAVLEAPR
jgi:hypothetical protein